MFEVAGTEFHRGVFEIFLEKESPFLLGLIQKMGPVQARAMGLLFLAFSFLFSTSHGPMQFMVEQKIAPTADAALLIQQKIGYVLFAIAVAYYLMVFFFRREIMEIRFDKGAQLYSLTRESPFRFTSPRRGNVPFVDIGKIEKISPHGEPSSPYGVIRISVPKMPNGLQKIEFRVLTDEQFEYFPLNIGRILNREL